MSPSSDTSIDGRFPLPPIVGSRRLVPITSWLEMVREARVTGVEFDQYWYESVEDGVAYFFSWTDDPRATVLVIWEDEGPTHIECRTIGDTPLPPEFSTPIIAEVVTLFRKAGFWQREAGH